VIHLALHAFLLCQFVVVLFLALHDWIPLGSLNNLAGIRAVDTPARLLLATVMSALPFAIGFAASLYYRTAGFPGWLWYWLWISYLACLYGILKAWYVPYVFGADPRRAARYQRRFAQTHAFLPIRNGIVPDTLHVCFHAIVLCALILLGVLTFFQTRAHEGQRAFAASRPSAAPSVTLSVCRVDVRGAP
jgi:hypothetical protein